MTLPAIASPTPNTTAMTTRARKTFRITTSFPLVEIVLQDHGRGRRVELLLARAPVFLADREPAFCFPARQTLVLECDRQAHRGFDSRRERLDDRRHVVR